MNCSSSIRLDARLLHITRNVEESAKRTDLKYNTDKILKISPSIKPLQIEGPQTRNAKNPPLSTAMF